jgi:uncharacterized membrane protein YhaH (DUF805 family)
MATLHLIFFAINRVFDESSVAMASETFEQVLTTAQAAGSLTAAWKKFVNTKFFVAIERSADNDPRNFSFYQHDSGGAPAVTISEVRERIAPPQGYPLVAISGADVVRRLHAESSILVALSEGAFKISRDRAEWLKTGIQAAHARAAEKAAPAPAPAPAAEPAPRTPVQRNQVGVLDVAALKPRSVAIDKIGLEFFIPGNWTDSTSATGLRFADPATGCTAEASGFQRAGLSMAQWLDMRLTLVRHEMRHLSQDGESYPFEGDNWRARVKGMATEFSGTFPGDAHESRVLVAAIWTDGVVASIMIRAPAEQFERQRALYKWLLGRVDMNPAAATIYSPPASAGSAGWENNDDDGETAPMFAFSLAGRMGRARVLAYTFPMMLALAVVGIVAAVMIPASKVLGGIVAIAGVSVVVWNCVRLLVLRMHDINLSGKWLLGTVVVLALAGVTKNLMLLGVVSLVFWLGSLVVYFLPGSAGENDYGAPPGPNSTLVKIGAALFILMQLGQIGAVGSGKYTSKLPFPGSGSRGGAAAASQVFTVPDGSFSVRLPGVPQEVPLPSAMASELGDIKLQHFQLVAHDNVYLIQSIDYGDRMPDNRFDAMDGMQESVIGKDGTLLEATPILLGNTSGRQVKVRVGANGLRAARIAVVGSRFFMVSISTPDGAGSGPAIDAFLRSFTLIQLR